MLPAFYDRGPDGLPPAWLARMHASLKTVPPNFAAGRMLRDYQGYYAGQGAAR